MSELGSLKFGLKTVPIKAAAKAPSSGNFSLQVNLTGGILNRLALEGPSGATASVDWGTTPSTSNSFTFTQNSRLQYVDDKTCGSVVTITGSGSITGMQLQQFTTKTISGITGTYPTSLNSLDVSFNNNNPSWIVPNIPKFIFYGIGPTSLTFGSKLTTIAGLPSNLTSINLSNSPLLTSLVGLPFGVKTLTPSPLSTSFSVRGATGITTLNIPPKLVSLDITGCSGLTNISLPSTLAKLKIEGSGLTSLDLTKTSITVLNIPPSMYPQLATLKVTGGKMVLTGLLGLQIPPGANWTLY